MEFKGTKGKWYINRWGNVTSENEEVAYMPSATFNEINAANALIISKAPEMLEMLTNTKTYLEQTQGNSAVLEDIKKLIKEATEL
jgi:hypothetical protein